MKTETAVLSIQKQRRATTVLVAFATTVVLTMVFWFSMKALATPSNEHNPPWVFKVGVEAVDVGAIYQVNERITEVNYWPDRNGWAETTSGMLITFTAPANDSAFPIAVTNAKKMYPLYASTVVSGPHPHGIGTGRKWELGQVQAGSVFTFTPAVTGNWPGLKLQSARQLSPNGNWVEVVKQIITNTVDVSNPSFTGIGSQIDFLRKFMHGEVNEFELKGSSDGKLTSKVVLMSSEVTVNVPLTATEGPLLFVTELLDEQSSMIMVAPWHLTVVAAPAITPTTTPIITATLMPTGTPTLAPTATPTSTIGFRLFVPAAASS